MTEETKPEEQADENLVVKFRDLIKKAADDGATPAQLGQLKAMWKQETGWSPTKKRLPKAARKDKRKAAKESRRRNRNTSKGIRNYKGIYYRTS